MTLTILSGLRTGWPDVLSCYILLTCVSKSLTKLQPSKKKKAESLKKNITGHASNTYDSLKDYEELVFMFMVKF